MTEMTDRPSEGSQPNSEEDSQQESPDMSKNTAKAYTVWQDNEERDRILLEQLPQVRYLARRIHERLPRHVPLEDLVHAGVIGLIDALNKFDRSKHVQFSSYAKFRIRGAILDSLREMDWGPRELRRKARGVEEAHRKLSMELSRAPTENEMAAALGLGLKEFQQLLGELDGLEVGSLRIESPWDGKEEDLCDYLPSAPEDTPFFRCLRGEMKDLLARVIAELPAERAAGAGAVLLRGTDHERSGSGAGHRRVAGLPNTFAGRGAAAGASGRTHARRGQNPGGAGGPLSRQFSPRRPDIR
jgi:RNA polymerase sigma factor (sigma-70 family)